MRTRAGEWVLAALVGGSLLAVLISVAFSVPDWQRSPTPKGETAAADVAQPTSSAMGMGLLGVRVDRLEEKNPQLQSGMSGYLLPFEIVSVHLLVVLIGAAYLARTKRRRAVGPPVRPGIFLAIPP